MRKYLLWMAVVIAAGLQLGCGAPGGVRLLSKPDQNCLTNATCFIDVYASVGSSGECNVSPQYENVYVAAGKTPWVVWRIEASDPHDRNDYRFVFTTLPAVNGVDLIGNDPNFDFDSPGLDNGNPARFRWRDIHGRARSLDYNLIVQRKAHGSSDPWSDCTRIDPRIVNY